MKLEMDSFGPTLKKMINKYEFEVGILQDKPHYEPIHPTQQKSFAGGPARKQSRIQSALSTAEILIKNMERMNVNLLLAPFREKNNKEIVQFTNSFLKMAISKGVTGRQRVINLLQAIVRNPILRQDYGPNSGHTADAKGFDRQLIDTGQVFNAIKARIVSSKGV